MAGAGLPAHEQPLSLAAGADGTLVLSYCCTDAHDGVGVARSTDYGRSWHAVGPAPGAGAAPAVTSLAGGGFLLAAASREAHRRLLVYRSADDGRTWQPVGALAQDPSDLAVLFAVPWDQRRVFAGFGVAHLRAVVVASADGGASFGQAMKLALPAGSLAGCVCGFAALSATRTLLLTAMSTVYRSTDGGRTWQAAQGAPFNGATIWTLLAAPDGRTVYAGTDRGLYRSADDGRTWSVLQQ
jgi:hypothetical protein